MNKIVNIRPKVYLSGPMRGLRYNEADDWRKYVQRLLYPEIVCLSPMRNKEHLKTMPAIYDSGQEITSTQSAIVARDRHDTINSDLMIVNLLDSPDRPSIGTSVEVGWADMARTPIVLVIEDDGNPVDHPFFRQLAGWHVTSLDEAAYVAKTVLLPDESEVDTCSSTQ